MVEFRQKLNLQAANSATRHQTKKVLPFIIICSVLLALLGVLCLVFRVDGEDYFLGIYLIVMGAVLPAVFFIVLKLAQRAQNKSMPLLGEDMQCVYSFYDNEVIITETKGDEYESRIRAKYSCFFKVEETNTHYFLYISKTQMHVIDKCNLTSGSIEELNSYLFNNIVCNYKRSDK